MAAAYDGSDPTKCNMFRKGRYCRNDAGKGTDHKGFGYCAKHGGTGEPMRRHAQKLMAKHAVATYGLPRNVDPHTALLEEVHRTAGHVAYLGERVAGMTDADLVWGTTKSERSTTEPANNGRPRSADPRTRDVSDPLEAPEESGTVAAPALSYTADVKTVEAAELSIWVRMYQAERKHLVEVCKTAIACGIAARQVEIAEQHGRAFVGAIFAILGRLGLDPRSDDVRLVVREQMALLMTGQEDA